MKGIAAALAALLVASACGGTAPVGVVPTASATATPAASSAPAATPSATLPAASPTPKPSPLTSAKGSITVTSPLRGDQVTSPLTITGDASVFEATLRWRVVTAGGAVLAEGNTLASAGAPQRGTFTTRVTFGLPYYGEAGFVEVFEVSPKDGSVSDIVRVPVAIEGSY